MTSHEAKMPEMPPAPTADAVLGPLYSRHDMQAYGRACYLAGLAAAKEAVPDSTFCDRHFSGGASSTRLAGFGMCRDQTLANIAALEKEAK